MSPQDAEPALVAVDSSALIAVLLDEPDAGLYLAKLLAPASLVISAVNWWEVQVRMRAMYGTKGTDQSAAWMEGIGLTVEPVTPPQAVLAVEAFARFAGRPAKLNMGDCFAYALAQSKRVPLLFKGTDFTHTDVTAY